LTEKAEIETIKKKQSVKREERQAQKQFGRKYKELLKILNGGRNF
jgi:hypothetical protein